MLSPRRSLRRKLGFKGAMLHGMSNGEFLDLKKFWPMRSQVMKIFATRRGVSP
jgi:hypothetical protein